MSKRSLGPWEAVKGEDNQNEGQRPDGVWGTILDKKQFHICRIWDDVAEPHEPEANAALIAAAPDLLEALKDVLDALGALNKWWELVGHGIDEKRAKEILAAIRKAEGGAE